MNTTPPTSVKVLIIDDLEENLIALEALLRGPDVEILLARSGRDALELLLVHEVALALIDVQMPEMDGFELAELMRGTERTRNVPIIFVTAGSRETQRVFRGYDAGAVDFLFKPVEPHVLRHKVATFQQLHRQKQILAHQLAELEQVKAALEKTLRLNEMFVAVVSHDLRNPLGAIMTGAEILMDKLEGSDRRILERMRSSSRRMAEMIEDLVDLARARLSGGIQIQAEPLDLGELAERVAAEQRALAPECEIRVSFEGDLRGVWDGSRLGQVLSNLLSNAVRHRTPSTPVWLYLEGKRPDSVRIGVRNAGSIDEALIPELFNPFRSGHAGRARSAGLGLGLYIVQQIVAAHAGSASVTSKPGEGVTVRVELPRRPPEA